MRLSISPIVATSACGAVLAVALVLLVYVGAPPIVILLLVVGIVVALAIWIHQKRIQAWRELSQRRAVFMLQATAAATIGRALAGLGIGALQASGTLSVATEDSDSSIALEYLVDLSPVLVPVPMLVDR
ncbi:MAG: hypothetical protein ACYTF9_10870 [Planctomycetota bacterium]|jgi:hypothetical protein